ncbi:IS200/IS605 family transposase [Nonomuraea sp. AD125B]|uniref:IS200/IS605 family transposase n=1 Tax=Nonomuraea sp. AD125B TaxID=3242897 RepID=UPI0035280092
MVRCHGPTFDLHKGRHLLGVRLVFVTKYRREVFTAPTRTYCDEIMRDACASFDIVLVEFNGEDDHVHLLVNIPPKIALRVLVNSLAGGSARHLRKEYDALWSRSSYAGSAGGANLATIRAYIQGQDRPTG